MEMKVVKRDEIFRGRVITVRRDLVELDGRERTWDVVAHPGAVVVLAVDGDDLLFVRQYRYAAGEELLELVAGTCEPGEDPATTAERELQEEAGFRARRLTKLCEFYSAPGFCTEKLHLFLAEELEPSRLPMDEDEQIALVRLSLDEALRMALAGELRDAKTLAGVLLYARRRGR
ncbi:MAG: NUDIX hydrolase [Symbiobacterium sp.]|uniref:NUDIX hydrolase n=1 Tax=Symbiobacterium sp. TaxID=1971213 RepID=UPI0034643D68